jgi:WS/DGAT/MGAT family acyltransferase
MVDGVAGSDLMQLMFDVSPDATHEAPRDWSPQRTPTGAGMVAGALAEAVAHPVRQISSMPAVGGPGRLARQLLDQGKTVASTLPSLAKQALTPTARSLNGPIGPHRRWAWTSSDFAELKEVRTALGGTVNDAVLAAIATGFRDLLQGRGELSSDRLVVRTMVPVSVRSDSQRGTMNNQISCVFVDLPVGNPDPLARLESIRGQMDEYKKAMQAVDVPSIIGMGDYVAPTLLALGVRAALTAGQVWCQAVTTNVPGPPIPLYVLGRRMCSTYAYVPIAGGTRCSIGIFSYQQTMTFGINADFDAFADVDVLSAGIRRGIDELLEHARAREATPEVEQPATTASNGKPGKRSAAAAR